MKKIYFFISILTFVSIANAQITEFNYGNNEQAFSLHIGTPPSSGIDLTVEAVTSPTQHHVSSPSGNWDIIFRVYNMGYSSISPLSIARVYVSTDKIFSNDDVLIQEENISQLNDGSFEEIASNISIPAGFNNGDYLYVIVVVDPENLVAEFNDNNNEQAFSLHIGTPPSSGIDLTVEAVTSPTQHHVSSPSGNWDIIFRVYNMGYSSTSPLSIARVYVSTDKIFSSDDVLIQEENISQLNDGSFEEITSNISIPAGFNNGDYLYVIVVTNPDNVLGTSEPRFNVHYSIYPNPSSRKIFLQIDSKLNNSNVEFLIIDNMGKTVFNEKVIKQSDIFNITSLKQGIYYCYLKSQKGKSEVRKIIIE